MVSRPCTFTNKGSGKITSLFFHSSTIRAISFRREWQLQRSNTTRQILKNFTIIDSLGYDVDILFVAWVHNYDELEILQRANRCQLPFLYDPQGDMQKINQFPAEPAFQTFLLDSLNRVLLIGSPVENDKIWTLYQRSLSSSPL